MKHFPKFCLLLVGITLGSFAHAQTPHAACIPDDPEAQKWPIKAIYLHGLFKVDGVPDTTNSHQAEMANRQYLQKLAAHYRKLHLRIALPIGSGISKANEHKWNDESLQDIEAAAQSACHGAPLANRRAILGFSNGALKADRISQLPASQIKDYKSIISIGSPMAGGSNNCNCFTKEIVHRFPPAEPGWIPKHLQSVLYGDPPPLQAPPPISSEGEQ
jgi:hypothetical protein